MTAKCKLDQVLHFETNNSWSNIYNNKLETDMRTEKLKCRDSSIYWHIQHRLQINKQLKSSQKCKDLSVYE